MFDVEVEVTDSSFIIKDQNHVLIVQEWGDNAVRVIDSPVHHFKRQVYYDRYYNRNQFAY